ncbi:non-canonical purine NTP pyrophosphatase [Thiomicrorhabdus immobilis]|uniref:dITP/XTP pyrophosphatase n=1 Tax=Thiomicrorhabdus immobilis TaxID=2791037 RepID=A0ABN6D2G3_9GAMM|nr:RdgB/HAM1 family non-canonical purine NTP pyrophosphatase [Thiomicrorhabdus immobilis]BCN94367.1 non-canonical purine NTP pyrophosphatase [Thiomicrorhabdus immobilis]
MKSLVLATGNPHKVVEIGAMLQGYDIEFALQTDFFTEEVEEDGLSYLENALKKARYASQKSGLPALADDSGLEVAALGDSPGIYSARYSQGYQGQKASDELNNQKLLNALQGLPYSQRKASYVCVMVLVHSANDPKPIIGMGQWHGEILMQPRTAYGVGYDPIMWLPQLVKSASEVPMAVKNQLSHRAQALKQVITQLEKAAL